MFRPKPPTPIETVSVKKTELVQSLSVTGAVGSKRFANLSPLASTKLVYIGAQVGDNVVTGQTIAILDQEILQKNIEKAVKELNKEKISFDIINDFNGDRSLSDTGLSVSARRQLETALNTLDQAKIQMEIQEIAKDQSVLWSPLDGILTRADAVVAGTTVGPTTVFFIIDPASLVFNMDVDEADIGRIKVGQKVKINLDAFPKETLNLAVSRIDFVSHTTVNGGNAFTVEVKLPEDNQNKYRVGMNGSADIITASKKNVLKIPLSGIIGGNKVYIKKGKVYVKKAVVLGIENDIDTEVAKGLSEGDIVATQPSNIPEKSK